MREHPQFQSGRPKAGSRNWYTVRAAANNEPAEIFIYDEIGVGWFGGGVSAEQFVKDVQALKLGKGDHLLVRINSPGGDLFDGNTISNYLMGSGYNVSMRIDGLAASAASIIAMAGNEITMPENSFLMIHNPWMFVAGDAQVMRKVADDLDVLREGAISAYKAKVGDKLSRQEITDMLDAETWLGAQEAVDKGFADIVDAPVKAAALARFDLDEFRHVPETLAKVREQVPGIKDRLAALREQKAALGA